MKYHTIIISFVLMVSLVGCTSNDKGKNGQQNKPDDEVRVSYVHQNDEKTKSLKRKGARIVKLSSSAIGKARKKAIEEKGAEHALDFCNQQSMNITDSLAKAENVIIRRVAKKNRNPENETNAVESKIYRQYIMEWLGNQPLKPKLTIDKNGHPVYYKPIIINKKCLTCHGKPGETIPEDLAAKIAELYPNDKAINFEDRHPRGMWAITFLDVTNIK